MKMKESTIVRNSRNDVALENNFMFTTVMKNKKACIRLLETIFGDEHRIADIRYARHPEAEKSILSDPMRRGVRLDVYFDDGKTVYDIELQRTSITDLAQRARLYSSSMDVAMLDKGEGFGSMRTSYVQVSERRCRGHRHGDQKRAFGCSGQICAEIQQRR